LLHVLFAHVLPRETRKTSLNLNAILLGLVLLTVDHEINSMFHIKIADLLRETVMPDLGQANEILKTKLKSIALEPIQLVCLKGEVKELLHFLELLLG
jgi:hypothetical protein